jgi:hypothetical protein
VTKVTQELNRLDHPISQDTATSCLAKHPFFVIILLQVSPSTRGPLVPYASCNLPPGKRCSSAMSCSYRIDNILEQVPRLLCLRDETACHPPDYHDKSPPRTQLKGHTGMEVGTDLPGTESGVWVV